VAVLVFDITSKLSFEELAYWAKETQQMQTLDSCFTVLVGNKCDLESKREVSKKDAEEYADRISAAFYMEVSAKIQKSIEDLFQEIGKRILKNAEEDVIPDVTYG